MSNPFALLDSDSEEEVPVQIKSTNNSSKSKNTKKVTNNRSSAAQKKKSSSNVSGTGFDDLNKKENSRRSRNSQVSRGAKARNNTDVKRGKREFDRRSGTGRGREIKKDGAGGHNWGNEKDAVAAATETPAAEDEENADKKEEAVEAEEEEVQLSLEEYKAQKNEKRHGEGFQKLQTRKLSTAESGYGKKVERAEEESFIHFGYQKKKIREKTQKKKKMVEVHFNVRDSSAPAPRERDNFRNGDRNRGERDNFRNGDRNRGGRGGRGRGRGRGGRGGSFGGRGGRGGSHGGREPNKKSVDTGDLEMFPSL